MKTLAFILGAILITSCATNRCGITEQYGETSVFKYIDSSDVYENPNDPGTFLKGFDTISVQKKTFLTRKGELRDELKIVKVSKTAYKLLN